MIYTLLSVVAVMVVGLNLFATFLVARSDRYETSQKLWQAAVIWFFPIIGAVLAWSLAKDSPSERVTTDLRDHLGSGDGYRNDSAADLGSGDGGGSGGE